MKSKTSCFNRTIFKKNFTHFWPLWLLYQIYLLVVIPVWVWQKAASPYYYYGTGARQLTGNRRAARSRGKCLWNE